VRRERKHCRGPSRVLAKLSRHRPPAPPPPSRRRRLESLPTPPPALGEKAAGAQLRKEVFSIVGIGASAGGLDAFMELLKHLPADSGLGFVLVQHLDPAHESALTQILGRVTAMPVGEAAEGQLVQPNHVYVIPNNAGLAIAQGC